MEIAIQQNRFETYLTEAKRLGFQTLEISDGTIPLDPATRRYCLKRAQKAGFTVITELGKKDPRQVLSLQDLTEQCAEDLANGAWKVIMEARTAEKESVFMISKDKYRKRSWKNSYKGCRPPKK